MLRLLLVCFLLPYVFGGSPCPPREELYPCICLDRRIGKSKFDTIVICQSLNVGKEPSLSGMDINTFLLYDSYWSRTTDSRLLQAQASIPVNHISKLKIEEVKIVDTTLSNFGCPTPDNCETNYIKRFTAINTTVTSERCTNGMTVNIWISCPATIEELTINKGLFSSPETTLKPDFFPESMNKLRILRLQNNHIRRLDKNTITNSRFPVLRILDLSYNSLTEAKYIFTSTLTVEELDLSNNNLRSIVDFLKLPNLKILKLKDNQIANLLENEWKILPTRINFIDLTNNKVVCDCNFKWFNASLPVHTAVHGVCVSPVETANIKIRKASRLVAERCNSEGNIMPSRVIKT